jgi:hypothetical protein
MGARQANSLTRRYAHKADAPCFTAERTLISMINYETKTQKLNNLKTLKLKNLKTQKLNFTVHQGI